MIKPVVILVINQRKNCRFELELLVILIACFFLLKKSNKLFSADGFKKRWGLNPLITEVIVFMVFLFKYCHLNNLIIKVRKDTIFLKIPKVGDRMQTAQHNFLA